jgi:hypothetical protein
MSSKLALLASVAFLAGVGFTIALDRTNEPAAPAPEPAPVLERFSLPGSDIPPPLRPPPPPSPAPPVEPAPPPPPLVVAAPPEPPRTPDGPPPIEPPLAPLELTLIGLSPAPPVAAEPAPPPLAEPAPLEAPPEPWLRGRVWVPGSWELRGGKWHWTRGRWVRRDARAESR